MSWKFLSLLKNHKPSLSPQVEYIMIWAAVAQYWSYLHWTQINTRQWLGSPLLLRLCLALWQLLYQCASLVARMVKNLPAMQETRVQSLGREDPLEKGMATHSSILVWRIPETEEPGGLTVHEVAENQTRLSN